MMSERILIVGDVNSTHALLPPIAFESAYSRQDYYNY